MTIQEINDKYQRHIAEARALLDRAKDEKRAMSSDEEEKFDLHHHEADVLLKLADQQKEQEKREREQVEREERQRLHRENRVRSGMPEGEEERQRQYGESFMGWVRGGVDSLSVEQRHLLHARSAHLDPTMQAELRALGTGSGAAGAYTIAEDFMSKIDVALLKYNGMFRAPVDVIRTSTGAALPYPTANDSSNEGELLGEGDAASELDPTIGQVVFNGYTYSSKVIRVQLQLLQDSAFDLESFLADIVGQRLGRVTAGHLTTGDGSSKPRGIVTAAVDSTIDFDISDGDPTYDELVDLQHSVDADYRESPACGWMFHDDALKVLRKLKDTADNPIWNQGVAGKEPPSLLGKPYFINQKMPTPGTNLNKSYIFGDLSKYKVRRVKDMVMMRLVERYAEYLQVAFLAFLRLDGDLVDAGTNPVKYANMVT